MIQPPNILKNKFNFPKAYLRVQVELTDFKFWTLRKLILQTRNWPEKKCQQYSNTETGTWACWTPTYTRQAFQLVWGWDQLAVVDMGSWAETCKAGRITSPRSVHIPVAVSKTSWVTRIEMKSRVSQPFSLGVVRGWEGNTNIILASLR